MDRRHFLATTGASAAAALLPRMAAAQAPAAAAATPADARLNAAFDAAFAQLIDRSPEFASNLGLDKGPNAARKRLLDDRSPGALKQDLALLKRATQRIEAIDPAPLSPAGRLNREVVLYSMKSQAIGPERFGVGSPVRPFTITQQQGAYFDVPDFLDSTHSIATADDAEAYLSRLALFATALDQDSETQSANAARGLLAPGFSLDLALGQMAALRAPAPADSSMVRSLVRRAREKGLAGDYRPRAAKIVAERVYPALDRQIALVTRLRGRARSSAGVWDLPDGDAIYAAALAAATTTDFTPDEVHRMGLEQVAQITAELDAILKSQGLTQGSVADRLGQLNTRPAQLYPDTAAGRTQLIADLNAGVAAMDARMPEFFLNPPKDPLEIRAVPVEIQDGASNGYYYQAPLDGSRPAIYWINLKSVADWPKYSLPSLTYHEGVPGHHLQISIVRTADTPVLRKISFFSGYVEGWALYAEQLADELGTYRDDPLGRAGFLQSFLFRAARLVVDTGLHAKRWTREQATDWMVANTGFARPRVQREVERYCTMPGQACSYKLGHAAWLRARDKARAILGDRFDIRQFHEVLRDGAVPLTILDRLVEDRARALKA